jgi:hypothetical protein
MASGFRPTGTGGGGGGVLAGDVSGPLLANVINPGVVTGGAGGMLANNTVTQQNLDSNALPYNNMLTNPDFNICQLYDPTVATVIADNAVSADAWKLTRENADATYQRVSNATIAGLHSAYSGRYTKTVALGKMMIYQPLEMIITQKCAARQIVFTIRLNLSAAHNMRIGFLVHNGASPNQVVPAPVFAWNAPGVYPTLNGGFFDLGNFAFAAPAGYSEWDATFSMPVFGVNDILSVIVLTDDQFAPGDFLDLLETELDIGDGGRFDSRAISEAEDIARCQRFIEKSYDLDTIPGTVTANGQVRDQAQNLVGGIAALPLVRYSAKVRVPVGAEVTIFSPSTGASGVAFDATTAADIAATTTDFGQRGLTVTVPGAASTDEVRDHYLVNTSL